MNVGQGSSGYFNYQVNNGKAQFILDAVYEATYLSAILHNRKKLYLTLIGGGVFGNDKSWIYNSIIKAHKKYGIKKSGLETVYVVFYSYFDLEEGFPTNLRQNKIPFRWVEYKSNEKRFKECFLCESLTKNKKSPKKKKREEKNDEMEVVREEEETKKKN